MEDRSLFSFDFIVEKISNIRGKYLCPGMAFLLMDFSPILVHVQQGEVCASVLDCSSAAYKMKRGKSCLMEMGPRELLKELREKGAEIVFLDLRREGSDPKVVGRAPLDLSTTVGSLEEAVRTNKLQRYSAHFCAGGRQSVHVLDTVSERVATVLIKYRLLSVDSTVRSHVRENRIKMKPNHSFCTAYAQELASDETSQKELPGKHVGRSASTLTGKFEKQYKCKKASIVRDTTLAVNACPQKQVLECTKLSTSPASSGSEGSVCNFSTEDSNAEEKHAESLEIYLLNSVCPPPLLYRSESPSHVQQSKLCPGTTVVPVDQTGKEVCLAGDTAANHWSVLMAHDQSTYPITVAQNELKTKSSDEVIKPSPPAIALPLLTALLEELSVLKTPAEVPPVANSTTASPKRELPEKATKCLQTDDIPVRVGPVHRVRKQKPPQQPTSVQFVRECCLKKHGYSGAMRVPKNKSIIYPPDIARNRRKVAARKQSNRTRSVVISERSSTESIEHVEERKITGQNTARVPSRVQNSEASPHNSQEEIVSSPTVRKLEVFVPQVSYAARSSEASTPVFGSGVSLHLAGDPDERSDAQTQTQNIADRVLHETTQEQTEDDTTLTSVSLENVSKNSNVEASLQTSSELRHDSGTDHEAYNKISEEQSTSLRMGETHSRTAAENINFVITQPSRRGSLQLSGEHPSPIPTRVSVDDSMAALSMPIGTHFKPGSLLSLGSQAAYDSLMSMDSLDNVDSAVLPKHHRRSLVYLATSQSSVEVGGSGDGKDDSVSEVGRISTQEDSRLEEHEYSDDFEQLSTCTSTGSSSTSFSETTS